MPEPNKPVPGAVPPAAPPKDSGAHVAKQGISKLVFAIATLATIIGGVAAAVQLWAYWHPEKKIEQPGPSDGDEWTEIRPGFKAKFGTGWEILDRNAYDAARRIQFGDLRIEEALGEKHYLVRRGDATRTAGFAMLAITNVSPSATLQSLIDEAKAAADQNSGMIAQGISLDAAELLETDAGECARFITGLYDSQGMPTLVMSYFVWYKDAQSFGLYFYSLPAEATIDSPEFLRIAKSVRFQ